MENTLLATSNLPISLPIMVVSYLPVVPPALLSFLTGVTETAVVPPPVAPLPASSSTAWAVVVVAAAVAEPSKRAAAESMNELEPYIY